MDETKTRKITVSRDFGTCIVCEKQGEIVFAYDRKIYKDRSGGACPNCLINRTAEVSDFPKDSKVMQPVIFTARGLRGEEPFASLLRAADEQNPQLLGETLQKTAADVSNMKREKDLEEARSLLKRAGKLQVVPNNRKQRRAQESADRKAEKPEARPKANKKARKAARKARKRTRRK
jgi:hypothetical protein